MRGFLIVLFAILAPKLGAQNLSWELSFKPRIGSQFFTRVTQVNDTIFQALGQDNGEFVICRITSMGDTSFLNLDSLLPNAFPLDHLATKTNGFVLAGGTSTGRTWVSAFDSIGSVIWQHELNQSGGLGDFKRIKRLNDDGYLIVGDRLSDNNLFFQDIVATRIDSIGNVLWEIHFPLINNQTAHDFVEMPDGSFFISGYSETVALGATPYIMQIDIEGNLIQEHYPQPAGFSNMNIYYSAIILNDDGTAILSGESSEPINSRKAFIAKLDTGVNVLWDTLFQSAARFFPSSLKNNQSLYYGYTVDSAIFLMTLDGNGNGLNHFRMPFGFQKTFSDYCVSPNGYLIGVGKDGVPNQSLTNELYAARYDSVGEAFVPDYCAWNVPEAGFYYDYQWPVLTLYDSSYAGLKYHDSIYHYEWYTSIGDTSLADTLTTLFDTTGGNTMDVTLIVTNWHGCKDTISRTLDFKVSAAQNTIQDYAVKMYPNPTYSVLRFEIRDKRVERYSVHILDLHGREMLRKESHSTSLEIDISTLASGIYVAEIRTDLGETRKQLIKH